MFINIEASVCKQHVTVVTAGGAARLNGFIKATDS